MNGKKWIILGVITIFASVLRFWQLGAVPPSLDWDEASIGWNAYSLLKTGSDEYGNRFPVAIRSFGDYKPPLYVYATIPSLAVFGLSEFAIRFPSALAGTLTVLMTFFLVRELTKNLLLAYWVTGLLAVSPWHLQFSRVAFEANLSLFFLVLGSFFLAIFLRKKSWQPFFLMTVSYVLSLYSYHSARVVIPAFLVGMAIYYKDIFWQQKKTVIMGCFFGLLLLFPLIGATLTGGLSARFSEVSIFSSAGLRDVAKNTIDRQQQLGKQDQTNGDLFGRALHSKVYTYARLLAKNYLDHFNFNFLFLNADGNGRHHAPGVGLLYLWELPFFLLGVYFLLIHRPRWLFFVLWWFLVAPLAAILTAETPHAVRSLLYLPAYQIVCAYGLVCLRRQALMVLASLFFAFNFFYFLHQYFVHLPLEYASSWQYGYKELVAKVQPLEGKYKQVYITTYNDQPYIYFLLYGQADPQRKNDGSFKLGFDKYRFVNLSNLSASQKDNFDDKILVASSPKDYFRPRTILDQVLYPDREVAFFLSHK